MSFIPVSRNYDIVTKLSDLELLFTIPGMPIYMGCVDTPQSEDAELPLNFYISKGSGMVQIDPLVPLDILYKEGHNPGVTGKLWDNHHDSFARFIMGHKPKSIFEIGGGGGVLFQKYKTYRKKIKWTIMDPLTNQILDATIIPEFFGENVSIPQEVDMVVHSHVLEHVYEPSIFFKTLGDGLKSGVKMCFSVPTIEDNVKNHYATSITFEHTYYCVDDYIQYWLGVNNFKVLEKVQFKNHSIFYAVEKVDHVENAGVLRASLYYYHTLRFLQFKRYYDQTIIELNSFLAKSEKKAYLFGGHVFSQFLISFGLDTSKIECVLDNNPEKQGKRLYGSSLMVNSPDILKGLQQPVVILRAGPYTDEIKKGILSINGTGVIFL